MALIPDSTVEFVKGVLYLPVLLGVVFIEVLKGLASEYLGKKTTGPGQDK